MRRVSGGLIGGPDGGLIGGPKMKKLTAISIKKAPDGKLGDGGGLELRKKGESGKWVWRYSITGKRREMGLGSYPEVSLGEARKIRDKWALMLAQGKDPISERQAEQDAIRREFEKNDPPLEALAADVLDARKASLKGDGKAGRWISPLEQHVFPKIGHKPISTIHQSDIRSALAPIWKSKHPTATKAIDRLRIIFRQGRLMGYDCDPFTIDAAKHMLGDVIHDVDPIPATPWQEIPNLYARLENTGQVAQCLRFMILTLVRASGCRGATFDEFSDDVWTVPAARMKGRPGKVSDFRVPLTDQAQHLVEHQRALGGTYLFSAQRGMPVTDSSLSKHMREMGEAGRPHGFRTSFRTWVQDTDACSWEVSETVLAHTIGNKVERSYARSDLLERRRIVMQKWADFVTGSSSNVVKIHG